MDYTGFVMRKDKAVAEIIGGRVVSVENGAPLYLQKMMDFEQWIRDRGADVSRSYFRNILRVLELPLKDIVPAVLYVNAACIADTYWIKSENESICYDDVTFKNDKFFEAALCGDPDIYDIDEKKTAELTNTGSYNKGWMLKDNEWYMYKTGKVGNIYAELFASKLAKEAGLDAVDYRYDNGYTVCKSFVSTGNDCCFEPAKGIIDKQKYKENIEISIKYGVKDKYMDIIFLDAIIRNADRHEFNYGFITGGDGSVKMAPIFDNNESLFYAGVPASLERKDILVTEFVEVYREYEYTLPVISENLIKKAAQETSKESGISADIAKITEFCMNAYRQIATT